MTPDLSQKPVVTPFFDERSNTISYIVQEPSGPACAVIDAVMDIDYAAGALNFDGADAMIAHIRDNDLLENLDGLSGLKGSGELVS